MKNIINYNVASLGTNFEDDMFPERSNENSEQLQMRGVELMDEQGVT